MNEVLLQMKIAEFEASLVILSSKAETKQESAAIDEFLKILRKESSILINKMEMHK